MQTIAGMPITRTLDPGPSASGAYLLTHPSKGLLMAAKVHPGGIGRDVWAQRMGALRKAAPEGIAKPAGYPHDPELGQIAAWLYVDGPLLSEVAGTLTSAQANEAILSIARTIRALHKDAGLTHGNIHVGQFRMSENKPVLLDAGWLWGQSAQGAAPAVDLQGLRRVAGELTAMSGSVRRAACYPTMNIDEIIDGIESAMRSERVSASDPSLAELWAVKAPAQAPVAAASPAGAAQSLPRDDGEPAAEAVAADEPAAAAPVVEELSDARPEPDAGSVALEAASQEQEQEGDGARGEQAEDGATSEGLLGQEPPTAGEPVPAEPEVEPAPERSPQASAAAVEEPDSAPIPETVEEHEPDSSHEDAEEPQEAPEGQEHRTVADDLLEPEPEDHEPEDEDLAPREAPEEPQNHPTADRDGASLAALGAVASGTTAVTTAHTAPQANAPTAPAPDAPDSKPERGRLSQQIQRAKDRLAAARAQKAQNSPAGDAETTRPAGSTAANATGTEGGIGGRAKAAFATRNGKIGAAAAGVILVGAIGLTAVNGIGNDDSQEAEQTTSTLTEDSRVVPLNYDSISDWSIDIPEGGQVFAATAGVVTLTSDSLTIHDTSSGEEIRTVELDEPASFIVETNIGDQDGIVWRAGNTLQAWTPEIGAGGDLIEGEIDEDTRITNSGDHMLLVRDNKPATIGPDGLIEFNDTPSELTPMAVDEDGVISGGFDVPVRVTAESGESRDVNLAAPKDDQRMHQWINAGHGYAAVIWSESPEAQADDQEVTLAIHSLDTGEVTAQVDGTWADLRPDDPSTEEQDGKNWITGQGSQTATYGNHVISLSDGTQTTQIPEDLTITKVKGQHVIAEDEDTTYVFRGAEEGYPISSNVIAQTPSQVITQKSGLLLSYPSLAV